MRNAIILSSIILQILFSNNKIVYDQSITLGRDKDPKQIQDISKLKIFINKLTWESLTIPGLRFWTNLLYPNSTISHFNIEEKIEAINFLIGHNIDPGKIISGITVRYLS